MKGRIMKRDATARKLRNYRFPVTLCNRLSTAAKDERRTETEVVTEALRQYFDRQLAERDKPRTPQADR